MTTMALVGFLISAMLLAYTSRLVARHLGADEAERFWIWTGASIGQIGVLSLALSLIDAFAPGPFLLGQVAIGAIASLTLRTRLPYLPESIALKQRVRDATRRVLRSPLLTLVVLLLGVLMVSTGIEQLMLPVYDFDDRMYHASRAAYWIQHQSLLAWETHNDRQIAFPLTGELMFGWPLMMCRSEPIARLVFWLAYPLSGIGIMLTLRAMGASLAWSMMGALLFCVTPIVLYHTQTVHPDLWLALMVVAAGFFAIRATMNLRSGFAILMYACFASLAFGTRAIALPLLPLVLLLALVLRLRLRGIALAMAGIALGLLLSGSLAVFLQNQWRDGNPLGSSQMRATHAPDRSPLQLYTHGVRAVLILIDLPLAPGERIRASIDRAKNSLADSLGAGNALPGEFPGQWPGPQHFQTPARSAGFSVAGWFVLPALLAGWVILIRDVRKTRSLGAIAMITLLVTPFWLATILAIRWCFRLQSASRSAGDGCASCWHCSLRRCSWARCGIGFSCFAPRFPRDNRRRGSLMSRSRNRFSSSILPQRSC
jgi:hypothetical protein